MEDMRSKKLNRAEMGSKKIEKIEKIEKKVKRYKNYNKNEDK